jgi:putative copper resistance protein D
VLEAGLTVSRFAHFAAMLALFGGALFPFYAGGIETERSTLWLRRWLTAAAALALISCVAWFLLTTASMAGDLAAALDPAALRTVITSTDFGPLWLAQLALVLVVLGLVAAQPRRVPSWAAALVSGVAPAALAETGHARATSGWLSPVHVVADAAHLLAAGIWLGGLWPLGLALARHRSAAGTKDDLAVGALLSGFSGVGYLAVAVLALTGLVNAWFLVGSVDRLRTSAYGRLLLAKLALFLIMASLAAANRFWITPALASERSADAPRWLTRVRRHVAFEQALGVAVIAVVSALGTLEPPGSG